MAVPASGNQLSLNSIYNELDDNNYNGGTTNADVSLTNLSTGGNPPGEAINQSSSSKPDGNTPHAMSEFRGYSHGTALPGFTLFYFASFCFCFILLCFSCCAFI